MAVIAYNNRSFTQNTWTVMYNGGSDFAMTSFNALNIGTASSVGLAFAVGDGTIVDGSNNAFYANLEVNTANTTGILLDDSLGFGNQIYWSSDSGKLLLPSGKQLLVAVTGGNVEVSMFGLEL
jgi:hypothetical protein